MTAPLDVEARTQQGVGSPTSQQVSWWLVHEFVTTLAGQANALPLAGTPAWCALDDSDPAKLLALAVAGEHHVLRVEAAQIALAEASREIASAVPWSRLGRDRGPSYIRRTA